MQRKAQRSATVQRRAEPTKRPVAPAAAALLQLQRTAGNRAVAGLVQAASARGPADAPLPIQRVKDSFDVKLEEKKLRLAVDFTSKHVAEDATGAEERTHQRYESGKMPWAMANGRMPNTVAKKDSWLDALSASETQVDTEADQWTNDVALQVGEAWQVKWIPGQNRYKVTEVSNVPLVAGGYGEAEYAAGGRRQRAKQVTGGKFVMNHIGDG